MKNLLIIAVAIIAIAIVGSYFSQKQATKKAQDASAKIEAMNDRINAELNKDMEDMSGASTYSEDMDLSGVHIMADGSVMLGDGTTISDATVNSAGMIVLPDGTEVKPMMDMR